MISRRSDAYQKWNESNIFYNELPTETTGKKLINCNKSIISNRMLCKGYVLFVVRAQPLALFVCQ